MQNNELSFKRVAPNPNWKDENREPRTDLEKALMWAWCEGYPLPMAPPPLWLTIFGIIGLFGFIVPGLLIIFGLYVWNEESWKKYEQLVRKWIDAGRPTTFTIH